VAVLSVVATVVASVVATVVESFVESVVETVVESVVESVVSLLPLSVSLFSSAAGHAAVANKMMLRVNPLRRMVQLQFGKVQGRRSSTTL